MKKLPQYLEDMFMIIAVEEETATGEPAQKISDRYKQEFIDEALTAKANPAGSSEPAGKGKGGRVKAESGNNNPYPRDNILPRDFNLANWWKWSFKLNTKAEIGDVHDKHTLKVKKGILFIEDPFHGGEKQSKWIELGGLDQLLSKEFEPKTIIVRNLFGWETGVNHTIINFKPIIHEIIEKAIDKEGYKVKYTPEEIAEKERLEMTGMFSLDDRPIEVEENPTKNPIQEIEKVYHDDFLRTPIARKLEGADRDKLWREIELTIQAMVKPMLENVMGLRLKANSKEGVYGSLQYPTKAVTKNEMKEIGPKIEKNRYFKLFLSLYLTAMIENFLNISEHQVMAFLKVVEGGKTWEDLRKKSNRLAFSKVVKMGLDSMMENISAGKLVIWAQGHGDEIAKLNEEAQKEQAKIDKKLGQQGKEFLEAQRGKKFESKVIKPKAGSKSAAQEVEEAGFKSYSQEELDKAYKSFKTGMSKEEFMKLLAKGKKK